MTENEFLLEDRLGVIRDTINKYGEEKFYLSFSGGKDSTVMHHLLDMALPNNRIPRVFSNTGIEYNDIVKFVKELAEQDDRFVIIYPKKNIKKMLDEVGYPFKSKEHSQKLYEWRHGKRNKEYLKKYLEGGRYGCPNILLYQFEDGFDLNISHKCCQELKKKPFKQYQKENGKQITITGMMKEEGGQRTTLNCIVTKDEKVIKFHPLAKVTKEWEDWFIEEYKIKLCELYYPPYDFTRTGCKGCPYSRTLRHDLETMPDAERKQCEYIWQPVYDEYRRLGYRLDSEVQMTLF